MSLEKTIPRVMKILRLSMMRLSICWKKRRLSLELFFLSFLSFSNSPEKMGTKPPDMAPSAKNLRKRLGNLKARMKASPMTVLPRKDVIRIVLISPKTRERAVKKDMDNACLPIFCSPNFLASQNVIFILTRQV